MPLAMQRITVAAFVFWHEVRCAPPQVGDVLLQSLWQGRLQPAALRSNLRSLSLEGAHGATLQGFPRLRNVHRLGWTLKQSMILLQRSLEPRASPWTG